MRRIILVALALACLPAQWLWSRPPALPEGGYFYLPTVPSGALVEASGAFEGGFAWVPLGRTPGPLASGSLVFPANLRVSLPGYRTAAVKVDSPETAPALRLEPSVPGARALYLLRDLSFVALAAVLLGLAGLDARRERRASEEAGRLRWLFAQGEVPEGVEVGGYVVGPRLGRGGMAAVYRARRARADGEVLAMKILLSAGRFQSEADILRGLSHPGIVAVLDWGEFAGRSYLVMEFVPGQTLAEWKGPMEPARWGRQVAEALAYAHARGIVHRDLKPSNVMVTDAPEARSRVRVMDFGIARRAGDEEGGGVGSPGYVAPEALSGGEVGPAADLYGLGALLYEMVAGRPAFTGATAVEVLMKQQREDPPPLEGPFGPLVAKLMARDPSARGTAAEAASALAQLEQDLA